jgi:hypothetical protein
MADLLGAITRARRVRMESDTPIQTNEPPVVNGIGTTTDIFAKRGDSLSGDYNRDVMDRSAMPSLEFAFEVRALVGAALEVGALPHGRRRLVPITGGTFEGPDLRGRILSGGSDWQVIHADGFSQLDSRYALETDEGALITVRNAGIRHAPSDVMNKLLAGKVVDPALVYFRTHPTFETAAPHLQWLMRSLFIGVGERYPSEVVVRFWRIL